MTVTTRWRSAYRCGCGSTSKFRPVIGHPVVCHAHGWTTVRLVWALDSNMGEWSGGAPESVQADTRSASQHRVASADSPELGHSGVVRSSRPGEPADDPARDRHADGDIPARVAAERKLPWGNGRSDTP